MQMNMTLTDQIKSARPEPYAELQAHAILAMQHEINEQEARNQMTITQSMRTLDTIDRTIS